MSRYNLVDEYWIPVIVDDKGHSQMVSLLDVFTNGSQYLQLAGDTQTQNFAVFRLLLAVLQTALLRYELDGEIREFPDEDWGYEDIDDLEEELNNTWLEIWQNESFPKIVVDYLEAWRDRFYLFDDKYPFYQVTASDIDASKISKKQASSISGKNINRMISESGNKIALFSPKFAASNNKEILAEDEIARWLITFQGYTGLSDKVIFGSEKYKSSKGWLFDIGGLYVEGNNLFESLTLNCILLHPDEKYRFNPPKPCWEFEPQARIQRYFETDSPDNLAELYTNWSRGIYIDPDIDATKAFECQIVKLPDIKHEDQFLEPMTLWRHNDTGPSKNKFTPRKHQANQSIWRSFGLIALPTYYSDKQRQPGIIAWLNYLTPLIGDRRLTICSVSMADDGNATSWVPVDELCDQLKIDDFVLTDVQENHWVPRIYDTVETTKRVVGLTFRNFLLDLKEIRNLATNDFVNERVTELYYHIDEPFRDWLISIDKDEDKDKKVIEWYDQLACLVRQQVDHLLKQAGPRDYTGIIKNKKDDKDSKILNIAIAHNKFTYYLNKELKEGRHD
ncbi:type I-E CRISPR-associated protein Cse1/CasA [Aerococcus urinaehominis]|uniref:Type I-E CRISPR-associated protein Cse1/CasA n=1 Tax=Aerococcus urinaehominis TaxID=128944 RepID=A0A120IB41_9LACT|nr:type I-E CRISPR-associated protein Cse1/CasA [Aerococcus urinaehominis]AMB99970.1 type I-E CRISPR-associated protein Cse1/CasA [Aerococcus urinaehominis]SDM45038.1 CRISPR system Cascade subunit CasA [Aerococcus urinaehominis]